MDSENAAQQSAQQKHHKIMMFGKKQRYIEVFQCSGEDMNLVLNGGGYQYQNQYTSSSTISAKPLTSGMLPSRPQQQAQPLQISIPPPITIPITIPQSASVLQNSASTSASIGTSGSNQPSTSSIIAQQQQAHFIAQQSLIARQQAAAAAQMQAAQQNEQMAFFQNLNFLQSPSSSGLLPNMSQNPYSYPLNPQIPQFYFLPRPAMLPMNLMPSNALSQMQYPGMSQNASYSQSAINAAAGSLQQSSQLAASGKRTYESAFRNDSMNVSAAKRAFHPPGSGNIYGNYPYS